LISLCASLPSFAAHGFDAKALAAELAEALRCGLLPPPRALLDARLVFAAVSYLALFWVALLAWRLSSSRLAACTAALALALSFEFHYHARQWAPDAPMAQFACLSVMWAQQYASGRARKHLYWSAIAAGLAAGTKFPGALALSAVGTAILCVEFEGASAGGRPGAFARSARAGLIAFLIMVGTFLVTTPGVIFDYDLVHSGVAMELRHYRGEGIAGVSHPNNVHAGLEHLGLLGLYLAAQALSYRPFVAVALFAVAVFGLVSLWRRVRIAAAVLLVLPCLYLPYFGYQRLLVVRNLEVLLPFLAVGFGLGVEALHQEGGALRLRQGLLAVLGLCLLANVQFLVHADATVIGRKSIDIAAAVGRWVDSRDQPVFLAPAARALTSSRTNDWVASGKLVLDPALADEALCLPADFEQMSARGDSKAIRVRANRPWIYRPLQEGPWEVNYSYYPTWRGDDRALVIDSSYYRELAGLP
jgi:hypothetical protein